MSLMRQETTYLLILILFVIYKLFDKSIWKKYTDHIDDERRKKSESNFNISHEGS